MEIPFGVHTYLSPSRQVSRQRLVNAYTEVNPEGSKTRTPIFGTPGVKEFATVGAGPLRGGIEWSGDLYVVSGERLLKVGESGNTQDCGLIPGIERVTFAAGDMLAIAANNNAYYWNGGVLEQVTDADFQGASQIAWLAGYYIYLKPDTGVFYISDVANPGSVQALNFATAEAAPDNTIAVLSDSTNIILFGERTMELWGLRGGSFPFIRYPNGVFDVGCAAKNSPAKHDNIAFWLADDKTVRMLDGGPKKISTEGIEDQFETYSRIDDAYGFCSTFSGRATYTLTFPTAKKTWQYSLNSGLWNELESFDVGHWRGHSTVEAYGKTYVLDTESAKVGYFDRSTFNEFSTQSVFKIVSAPVAQENVWLFHNNILFDFEPGSVGDVSIRWSDDGFNWSDFYTRSLGGTGNYSEKLQIDSTGRAKNRVYEVSISDNVKRYFQGASGDIQLGGR